MRIGYVMTEGRGATNRLLATLADQLTAQGLRLAGTVQFDQECDDGNKCDMDLRLLPDGPVIRISQNLGAAAQGCRLDPHALEQAVAMTDQQIEKGADLLIINKFGKHEAEGRGFRNTIALALDADIPVLIGTNPTNFNAFQDYTSGVADNAGSNLQSLLNWLALPPSA
ncbi:ABC-type molybdate transport system, ATPase component [Thalassovita gelatinovora]|uniref:ABC-type molybdate transport system, ATPase component n=1 Tax=Thalassovita gelatinovora TaxID=53501 RepID=A0A0P1F5R2_THAGE|nr:DUF2478 domain-containing protein [Thalassovita gelatinovora]QIZ80803.1 DUF2478 domain-containing protein [Thalassovita gelatinovora]CUH63196.1 ABC-type molybdate transport system, ATPase component [Thalassovita gelatinovora]SEQ63279.1 Protein of unknown function [Thalassovita gelatinovora]